MLPRPQLPEERYHHLLRIVAKRIKFNNICRNAIDNDEFDNKKCDKKLLKVKGGRKIISFSVVHRIQLDERVALKVDVLVEEQSV